MSEAISVQSLSFISNLAKDYLALNKSVERLYSYAPTMDGLLKSIDSKAKNYTKRDLLNKIVSYNYQSRDIVCEQEDINLDFLNKNGLAITTAHQPNLFLGPLYTITKAISTIKLAQQLNQVQSEYPIIPVYIIGSEDHDKEELLNVNLFGKQYEWSTSQTGAIGSMKVDDSLIQVLDEFTSTFGNQIYAEELRKIYEDAYSKSNTLAQSTAILLRKLLGKYGLIVLDINLPEVKSEMKPIFEKELRSKFTYNTLQSNLEFLNKNYSIQAQPREINLFEYKDNERIRVDQVDDNLLNKLDNFPDLFSPNVFLRPIMQQLVIPSIANIGGAAEVAYWLELKPMFDELNLDFPAIILRDLICPIDSKSYTKWKESNLSLDDFFLHSDDLKRKLALQDSQAEEIFSDLNSKLSKSWVELQTYIESVDKTLIDSVKGEISKQEKSVELLFSKVVKAEKRKNEEKITSLDRIKNKIFENNNLIERKENFSAYYLRYGQVWIEKMIECANPLEAELKILIL